MKIGSYFINPQNNYYGKTTNQNQKKSGNNTNSLSFKRYFPTPRNSVSIPKAVDFLKSYLDKRIAIIGHSSPDGDAGGSMLGLGRSLKSAFNIKPELFVAKPLPPNVGFLAKLDEVTVVNNIIPKSINSEKDAAEFLKNQYGRFDLVITVDTPNLGSFDNVIRYGILEPAESRLKLDHHKSHLPDSNFGDVEVVDQTLDSNSQLIMQFAESFGLLKRGKITKDISDPLTMGLVTDTVQLAETKQFGETSAFIDIADLSRTSNVSEIINKSGQLTMEGLNDFNFIMSHLKYDEKSKAIYYIINTDEHPSAVKALRQKITNLIKNVQEIEYSFSITQKKQADGSNRLAVSMRSNTKSLLDVVAQLGGGGSNPYACGFKTTGNSEELTQKILSLLAQT